MATYEVTTEITEVNLPSISGYSTATVAFASNSAETYNLGENQDVIGTTSSIPKGPDHRLKVTSCVQNAEGCISETVAWLYYELINNGADYKFYKSDTESGTAEPIATLSTTTTDPTNTTLEAVFQAPGGGEVIIIIGDLVIDPPIE